MCDSRLEYTEEVVPMGGGWSAGVRGTEGTDKYVSYVRLTSDCIPRATKTYCEI